MAVPKFEAPYPAKYGSANTTDKEVEVQSGPNTIDIVLR